MDFRNPTPRSVVAAHDNFHPTVLLVHRQNPRSRTEDRAHRTALLRERVQGDLSIGHSCPDRIVGRHAGTPVQTSIARQEIQNAVAGYPGLVRDVQTYLKERIREVLTGSSKAITVRLYGHDLDELRRLAEEIKEKLDGVDGVVDLNVEAQKLIPQIKVKVDLEKAKQYAIKPGDVHRAVCRMVNGQEAGDIHIGNRTWDVHVWSIPEARQSVTNIKEMLVSTPNGQKIELQDVADVHIGPTPNGVYRENLKRKIDIGANVSGDRDLGSVYHDVEAAIAGINFPNEYSLC